VKKLKVKVNYPPEEPQRTHHGPVCGVVLGEEVGLRSTDVESLVAPQL
jgi:hypothetical protein